MAHKEMLTAWLKDAYSMEVALVPILENHAKDAKDHPTMQARIQQHIQETKQHAELLKSCLARYDEKPSAIKTAIGGMTGGMQSVATGPFKDELVKNGISDYAAENFEIASYNALIAAARAIGDQDTVNDCTQILRDEQSMADWLEKNLPVAVEDTLHEKMMKHS